MSIPQPEKPRRRWPRVVAIAVLAILTLIGTSYGVLQTAGGQRWAGNFAARILAGPGPRDIRIDRLAVVSAGRLELAGVALVDRRGDWLVSPRLTIDWRPSRLLRGQFAIEAVSTDRVEIRRRPEEEARKTATTAPLLPSLPTNIGAVSIGALHLDEAVFGVAAEFRVRGRGPIAGADSMDVEFVADRLDRTGDGITFSSQFMPANRQLEIRLVAREARAGVLARALGLSAADDLAIELRGTGSIDDWSASLEARVGGGTAAHARIAIQDVTGSALRYRIEGRLDVPRLAAVGWPAAVRSSTGFRVEGQWRREVNRLEVDVANVANAAGVVDLDGRIDLDTSLVSGMARLDVRDGSWIGMLSDGAIRVDRVSAETSFQGPLHAPGLRGVATVSGLRSPYVGASSARLSLDLKGAEGAAGPRRRFDAKLTSGALDFPDASLAALIGAQADLALSGNVDLATGRLVGLKGRLRGASLILAMSEGTVDPATPAGSLAIEASVTDLARLDDGKGTHLSGGVKTAGRLAFSASGFTATVSGQATKIGTGLAPLDALLGPSATFEGVAESGPDGPVVIRDLKLSGRSLAVGGGAKFDPSNQTVTADYTIEIADLAALTASVGTALRGRAVATGTARGPLADPEIDLKFQASGLPLPDPLAGPLRGELTAKSLVSAPHGAIAATADSAAGRIVASLDYRLVEAKEIRLSEIAVRGLGAELSGGILAPLNGTPIRGALEGRVDDLATLAPLAAIPLGGSARIAVDLADKRNRQTARLRVDAKDLRIGTEVRVGAASCTFRLEALGPTPDAGAECAGQTVRSGAWTSTAVSATATGGMSSIAFTAAAEGTQPIKHAVSVAGKWTRADDRATLELARLVGSVAGQDIRLARPIVVVLAPDRFDLNPTRIVLGDGSLDVFARRDRDALEGSLRIDQAPLSIVGAILPRFAANGNMDLDATLGGTTRRPSMVYSIAVADLTVQQMSEARAPPLSGEIRGRYGDDVLSATARLRGAADIVLEARATLPVRISLAPVSLAVLPDQPLSATAEWHGDLAQLSVIWPIPGNTFAGTTRLRVGLAGALGDPRISGSLRIEDGRYENLVAGMVLSSVIVEADTDGRRLVLRRIEAGDGEAGRLSGSGTVDLSPAKDFPVDLSLSILRAALVRRDDITAVLNGRLTLAGNVRDLMVAGTIEPERIEWLVGQPLPLGVIDLEVTEIDGTGQVSVAPEVGERPTRPSRVGLDLAIAMPGQVFVRGRGLDSEWRGDLKARGTLDDPRIEGDLQPVRGQFEFAGKAFKLVGKQVRFVPGNKIDPELDIVAEHAAKAIKAEIALTGKASRPKIALRSTPRLPRDEIVARVLFGKGVGQLSQIEAAQLGIAVATLSGAGGGLGVFDLVRRTLGVDVLRAGTGEDGTANVTVGKYVSDGVFVGVEQGAAANTGKVKVEAEVLPNVSVKSGVGADAQSNVGVQFKWDY